MKSRTLGELCDQTGGYVQTGPFGSQLHQSDYKNDGIPVVMPQDIIDDRISDDRIARIDDALAKKLGRHLLAEGDIVFPRRGNISKRAFIDSSQSGYFCGTGCLKIYIPSTEISSKWLFYYLGQDHIVKWIESKAIGATMLNLNTGILRSLLIRYPDMIEQLRVVDYLEVYDDLIATNRRRIQLLKDSARRIYREVEKNQPGEANYFQLYEIGRIAGIFDGPHATPALHLQGVAVFLGIREITADGHIELSEARWVSEADYPKWTKRVTPEGGDIVFTYEATLNRYALIPDGLRCCLGRRTALIRPNPEKVNPRFLFHHLFSPEWRSQIDANVVAGATVDRISLKKFPAFQVKLPPREVQDSIADTLSTYDELIENLGRQRRCLKAAKELLLPKLMSGQLDVSRIPLPENMAA
ncbi:restriction endonuclease subunit S [uncultured Thiodictyon sp.]|uniref:restriction endonuclease subunit S n=1 Tax=uncultured Thiodictyon sp. TaxID=1846217 RepID=UPI0025EF91E1|nr:restriction endonuclease subunit S [uncultured Thiodictyon sp.]